MHCLLNTVPLLRTRSVLGQGAAVSKADPVPTARELTGNYYVTLVSFVRGSIGSV